MPTSVAWSIFSAASVLRFWLVTFAMKLRRKYVFLFGVLGVAAGVRVHTGQGYLEPSLTGLVRLSSSAEANRALDVELTNRDSGRPQRHGWPLWVSGTEGTVSLHCHEWKQVSLYGVSIFGLRWNEFHRVVRVDDSIRGADEDYDYVISWRVRRPIAERRSDSP